LRTQEKRQYYIKTLFEHQEFLYSDLGVQNIETICQGIESLNKKSETQLLQLGYDSIKATQYVGMVQVGDVVIEVLPKIDYRSEFNNQEKKNITAGRNLLVMLSYAYNINFDSNTLSSLTEQTGHWYDLLIRYFAIELHKQIGIGLSKNYNPREESLPFIRGQWDISRQMRKHAYSMLEFDLNFDEFTENILINQVFKTVVQLLIYQTTDKESKRLLLDINQMLSNVNMLIKIDDSTVERVHFTRLNNRFRNAFQLARLFFSGKSLQVRAGNMTAFAFLFDMNRLFEKFVLNFLIHHKSSIFRNFNRTPVIKSQTAIKTIYLAKEFASGKRLVQLRPDIVLIDPTTKGNWLIIDTK
jgi:5-methylcytosine-specific restriction enzyme subunit McrC